MSAPALRITQNQSAYSMRPIVCVSEERERERERENEKGGWCMQYAPHVY